MKRENIQPLMDALSDALNGIDYEVIFVDDGSTDGTQKEILQICR
jgi:glycosyltransferase involved in cell wall biosynthesis